MMKCGVCLREAMVNAQILSCLHSFCQECIPLQNVGGSRFVVCPQCRSVTQASAIKDDFKLRELIDTQNASRDISTTRKVAHHINEVLLLTKKELQTSLETVKEKNRQFKDVVVSKIRAAKRKWVEAFEESCRELEQEVEVRVDMDSRVEALKDAVATVDTRIQAMTSLMDNSSIASETSAVDSMIENAKGVVKLLDCIPGPTSGRAIRMWKNWDIEEDDHDIYIAVETFLNPSSSYALKRGHYDQQENLPLVIWKKIGDPGYVPYIDPDDPDDGADTEEETSTEETC